MKRRPRALPIASSLAVHGAFFAWLFAGPLPHKRPSAYDQMIRPQETKLVWYNFKRKLPDVSPSTHRADNQPLRAEVLEKQQIVSSPKDAPKATQMIFHPVPQLKPQPVTPLPNMIALAAPPPPRQIAPPALPAKVTPAAIPVPTLPKLFTSPPEHRPQLQAKVELAPAPAVLTASATPAPTRVSTLDQASRIWVFRPQTKASKTASVGSLPDAPALQNPSLSNANVAVVGLNPMDNLKAPLPEGSRSAQFSGGPKLNPNGATSSGFSSGITVPDLTVRGGEKSAPSSIIAQTMSPLYGTPTSREALHGVAHGDANSAAGDPQPALPTGTRVSGAPDPRFQGRTVFSVAIQTPNLTSHMGSWLMWYADRSFAFNRTAISAPEPLHEVDPRYVATAVEERVEGTVRLAFVIGQDGHVYSVETVKGVDPRLDRSATEALQKWTFTPATREGKPIDVDAVVEIPFRLAPPPLK